MIIKGGRTMNLFNKLNLEQFGELLGKALEEELFNPKSENEIYDEIADYYFMLLNMLGINSFETLHFSDYEDSRIVVVNGKEYDFDSEFCHNDSEATEALCAIDCSISDLEGIRMESVLKNTEDIVNKRNR